MYKRQPIISYIVTATGCYATVPVTINPLPSSILGTTLICLSTTSTLSDGVPGGTWSSASSAIAAIGALTGVAQGMGVGTTTITYTIPATGCRTTTPITVQAPPVAITGTAVVCAGMTTTLNDLTAGGSWSSATPSIATIDGAGVVYGLSAGTVLMSYSLGTCNTTRLVTVNPLPAPITGLNYACAAGASTALSDATPGGTWSLSNPAIATINSSGVVTSLTVGSVTVTYTCLLYTSPSPRD